MTLSILFICLGNICRSPALQGTLRHLALQKGLELNIDSCGLGWFHLGEHPDPRAFEAAKKRGILLDHRAQQFSEADLDTFDYLFAVDSDVAEQIKLHAKTEAQKAKVHLATAFSRKYKNQPIPDPYYMGLSGFEQMMDLAIDSCEGILEHLERKEYTI